jgi:hypothetical protein
MSFQATALILTWIAVLLLGLVVSGLVRQVHQLSSGVVRRAGQVGPAIGSPAIALDRLGLDRLGVDRLGVDRLGVDRSAPALLLFLSAGCRTCADVLDEAAALDGRTGASIRALYPGDVPATAPPIQAYGGQAELFERYDAVATPFAVLVGPDGRVAGSGPLGSRQALRTLLGPLVREQAASLAGETR